MKKKKLSNLIMILVIVAVAAGGVTLALHLRQGADTGIGSQYRISELKDNSLLKEGEENRCTITIVCDTVLDNLEDLEEGKLPYVPADGVILKKTTVSFTAGDTVFDVLQKVCTSADIPLEYSWTPLYDSYYIEGINHLYEFDCGFQSGWMYRVNNWFPNYGCSACELKDGDDIVWCYTCKGLGEDVGETWMGDSQ